MKEIVFIKKNKEKWKVYEYLLTKKKHVNSDELTSIYLDITDDLAYANTYYPESKTTQYLHELAGIIHRRIYKTQKTGRNDSIRFFIHDFPLMFYPYRKYLLYSFAFFILFSLIGAFSSSQDTDFVRLILGNAYVDMTLENIQKNDPMAVYKKTNEVDMFLGITINNIKVAVYAFTMGILIGLGTLYILMKNAIMLGAFQYFFFAHGAGWESVKTIWIHGTIEIFVIIVAGAAGFIMASGILLPGTYTRKYAFIQKANVGLKVMISTIPFFIIAGFLEGFVTRHTKMPSWLSFLIIFFSLTLMLFYYFWYPQFLHNKKTHYEKNI